MASKKISLLLSDVDGTLVDSKKRISARAKAAIEKVHEAGIKFAVTSGRAPRGMKMIVEQVKLSAPFAAFNGGMFVEPDTMKILNSLRLDSETAKAVIDRIESFDLEVWVYADVEWYLRNLDTPHRQKEEQTEQNSNTEFMPGAPQRRGTVSQASPLLDLQPITSMSPIRRQTRERSSNGFLIG